MHRYAYLFVFFFFFLQVICCTFHVYNCDRMSKSRIFTRVNIPYHNHYIGIYVKDTRTKNMKNCKQCSNRGGSSRGSDKRPGPLEFRAKTISIIYRAGVSRPNGRVMCRVHFLRESSLAEDPRSWKIIEDTQLHRSTVRVIVPGKKITRSIRFFFKRFSAR